MTTERKLYIAGFVVLVLVLAVFGKGWILEREARIRAEVTQQADDKMIADSQTAIRTRDAAAAQVTAALTAQAAAIQTPQQAAKVIVQYLPAPASAPGQPATPPASIPIVNREQISSDVALPDAPSYGILTQQQLVDQAKQDLACQATGTQLTACQQDKIDLQTQLAAEKDETAKWEAAAKGGTKFQRFLRVAKSIGCAAAGAGIGAVAYRDAPAIGATAGGAAGVTICSVF